VCSSDLILECTKAIQLDPTLYIAYINRAGAYNMKGQYDLVIKDCTEAIRLNPDFPPVYLTRAIAYKNLGDREKALGDFKSLLDISRNPQLMEIAQHQIEELSR